MALEHCPHPFRPCVGPTTTCISLPRTQQTLSMAGESDTGERDRAAAHRTPRNITLQNHTRRAFTVGLAAVPAVLVGLSGIAKAGAHDPIFLLIERDRAAAEAMSATG